MSQENQSQDSSGESLTPEKSPTETPSQSDFIDSLTQQLADLVNVSPETLMYDRLTPEQRSLQLDTWKHSKRKEVQRRMLEMLEEPESE